MTYERGIPAIQYAQSTQLEGLRRMQHDRDNQPLFEGFDETAIPESTTTGERRRLRQAAAVAAGYHPLHVTIAGVKLHPDANLDVPKGTRSAPFTCGTCVHRVSKHGGAKAYPKCGIEGRDSHSDATDVQASWPACTEYEKKPPNPLTNITITNPAPTMAMQLEEQLRRDPCSVTGHRPAYHTAGGTACFDCGKRLS